MNQKAKQWFHTSTMNCSFHIHPSTMVVDLSVRTSTMFGLFLCVLVWKMTKTQAMTASLIVKASSVFGWNEIQTSSMKSMKQKKKAKLLAVCVNMSCERPFWLCALWCDVMKLINEGKYMEKMKNLKNHKIFMVFVYGS